MKRILSSTPTFRKIRAYAFDPSLSLTIDTVGINTIEYLIFWEDLKLGPIGEYVEIIDYDPSVKKFYAPVDLQDKHILAQNGLSPSESNPQFHQQMAYAVSMLTIQNFEKALGRKILWAPRRLEDQTKYEEYVQRLRIYPHALCEANAYYSPYKKALLFGYFSSAPNEASQQMPGSLVFTCLSHDVIAHEVTHAIIDGMHEEYNRPSNPDVLAFHEAFADIVALFQHFTFPEVLKHQIAQTRGDLASQNLLGQLAQELGSAIGSYGSLRDAIGEIDLKTKEWKPRIPSPSDYQRSIEPHERGSILVAAIFEAFINIYKNRISDLLRIASNGTGILHQGELHPDLTNRLASEASKAADHVLNMCIRALDYCPPVDINFGDFLRGIITADVDLVMEDLRGYRLAFIDAFRKRGIFPKEIKTFSIESLEHRQWNIGYKLGANNYLTDDINSASVSQYTKEMLNIICNFLREYGNEVKYKSNRKEIYDITRKYIRGDYEINENGGNQRVVGLHERLQKKFNASPDFSEITGLVFSNNFREFGLVPSKYPDAPSFQIKNLRLVSRVGPERAILNNVIFSIIQRSYVRVKEGKIVGFYTPLNENDDNPTDVMEVHCGCTLIFDLDSLKLKYAISKPLVDIGMAAKDSLKINEERIRNQYIYQFEEGLQSMNDQGNYFFKDFQQNGYSEIFAMLHNHKTQPNE